LKSEIEVFCLEMAGRYFRTTVPGEVVLLSTEMFREGTALKPSGSKGQDFAILQVYRDVS
jgi:hypothetical protein